LAIRAARRAAGLTVVEGTARATREAGGGMGDLERACRDGAAKGKARPPSAAT